jgi:AGZA family xanthine/uracil permease-like MFS transporter
MSNLYPGETQMLVDRIFRLRENNTDVRTEVIAGVVTFMTMAYVLFVHPAILADAGMPFDAVLFATCVATAAATLIMAFGANYPFALAPGMGLNAYFAYTAVPFIARTLGIEDAWKVALGAVFISGCIFILLTFSRVRVMIINAVPEALKVGIAAGIGIFIAMMGLQKAGIITYSESTMVTLGQIRSPQTVLAVFGLVLTGVLMARKVRGAILFGIIITTLAGIPFNLVEIPEKLVSIPDVKPTLLALDIPGAIKMGLLNIIFVFLFIDLFDTMGTLVGVGERGGFMVEGKLPRANRALFADAGGTVFGSLLGTSTVTTYIESAAGISEGGRTGLTAVVTALLFLACIVITPIASMVPAAATAPALIIVGSLMMAVVGRIRWEAPDEAIPAFLTMIAVPLTFSIANGLAVGFITYPLIKAFSGRWKDVSIIVYVLAALFILRFAMLSY